MATRHLPEKWKLLSTEHLFEPRYLLETREVLYTRQLSHKAQLSGKEQTGKYVHTKDRNSQMDIVSYRQWSKQKSNWKQDIHF